MIRQLPAGFALVIRGGCAPVIARLPRAWNNPVRRRVQPYAPSSAAHEQVRPVPQFSQWPQPDISDDVLAELTSGDETSVPWS